MKIGTDGVLLGAWAKIDSAKHILDIGAGTGVIALMAAQKNDQANIVGIEIDEASAKEATNNATNSPWNSRVKILNTSLQDFVKHHNDKFDHILSNPPFFTGGTLSSSQDKTSVRHTVKLSHSDLLRATQSLLSNEGRFSVILPHIEGLRFIEMAKSYNLYPIRQCDVYPDQTKKLERLLITFCKKESSDVIPEVLYIRDSPSSEFSEDYKFLTKDFYLNF